MKALIAVAAVAAFLPLSAWAECPYPVAPKNMPDGAKASLDEMMTMKKAVKDYDDATTTYLDCIKKDHDDAVAAIPDVTNDKGKKAKADLDRVEAEKHNAAVTQDQTVADHFNEQVRVFKARDQKK
jgi:hypothetical protein